jgi:very-short-patch-repair endonuclease
MKTTIVIAILAGIVLLAIALGAKTILGRLKALVSTKAGRSPFEARPLMNRSEHEMYLRLLRAAPEGCMVLAQVQMSSFLKARGLEGKERWHYLNRIIRLSLDFIVVDARTMWPVAGIELDGPTHRGGGAFMSGQMDADARKSQAMESAGLPLLRVSTRQRVSNEELGEWMTRSLQRRAQGA